jgi:hypothetical protein
MRSNRLLAALAAAAMVVSTVASASAGEKRYRATRAIVVDQASGEVRLPTQTEVDAVVATLAVLGQKEQVGPAVVSAGGTETVDLDGGFAGVLLARPGANGAWETLCVFTIEEGAAFLGLVDDVQ